MLFRSGVVAITHVSQGSFSVGKPACITFLIRRTLVTQSPLLSGTPCRVVCELLFSDSLSVRVVVTLVSPCSCIIASKGASIGHTPWASSSLIRCSYCSCIVIR